MVTWYRRLADVPGVGYAPAVGVNRKKLKGNDLVPEVRAFSLDGKKHESLSWAGGGSQSPAKEHTAASPRETSVAAALKHLAEVLELPGEPADYHFALQGCVESLHRQRRDDPAVYAEIERLCWLNIRLLEACPSAVEFENGGETRYFRILAFAYLVGLYSQEGFLKEALEVAERGARFKQEGLGAEELHLRLARVVAEDATNASP
ncbi:MAG TPA: hypothetical protein VFB63_01395 [Bryobacteraceae bacterium]|jgi:hypothetical protein|nr:hypothetical protein [Bryobacteraceae bacterium]